MKAWFDKECDIDYLVRFLRFSDIISIFCEIEERVLLNIFSFFDFQHQAALNFAQFFHCFSILIAQDVKCLTFYLYQHSDFLFRCSQDVSLSYSISSSALLKVARVLQIPTNIILPALYKLNIGDRSRSFSVQSHQPITKRVFVAYYYLVFKNCDKGRSDFDHSSSMSDVCSLPSADISYDEYEATSISEDSFIEKSLIFEGDTFHESQTKESTATEQSSSCNIV
ncbi:hypothetical protein ADUPG1_008238 [Aduncisulcus paluster]|uniref:Maturase K n=1 Tax=Aduncisulcus paluster TaxID=2918883 RepID=A0ABQ5KR88_9EUKA|nr:hypothetical protein ADUPG1_008238 [Aduncisulcus paluster]